MFIKKSENCIMKQETHGLMCSMNIETNDVKTWTWNDGESNRNFNEDTKFYEHIHLPFSAVPLVTLQPLVNFTGLSFRPLAVVLVLIGSIIALAIVIGVIDLERLSDGYSLMATVFVVT